MPSASGLLSILARVRGDSHPLVLKRRDRGSLRWVLVLASQPFSELIGARVTQSVSGLATIEVPTRDDLLQQFGFVHAVCRADLRVIGDSRLYAVAHGRVHTADPYRRDESPEA